MKKTLYILISLVVLASCNRTTPSPKRGIPDRYTLTYQEIYGHCYDSLPNVAVVALDAYSDGLSLDTAHHIQGTGYNLYLSDIFVPDSLLVPGTYHSDTTGKPFTFLPGMNFEGYPHGIYLLNIEENNVAAIQVIDSGYFVYRNDSICLTLYFKNSYGTKATYNCYLTGPLLPWQKQ